jgi:DNA-directed RNA polymerase specialized sigma24 family protein
VSPDQALVSRAVQRDAAACRELMQRCSPVIRQRVGRVLRAFEARRGRATTRGDVLDLMQEIFVLLLDRDARVLRAWDVTRGLSLDNFVGLVAEREARSILLSGKRSAWAERPTEALTLAEHLHDDDVERDVATREQLGHVLAVLQKTLSPAHLALFEALFVHERSIEEVAAEFDTTPNALYTFRSRLRRELAELSNGASLVCSGDS